MIDSVLVFNDEPSAIADPVVGAYYIPPQQDFAGAWRGDVVHPNQTVTDYSLPYQSFVPVEDGPWTPVTLYTILPGFFLTISLEQYDETLVDHPNCVISADREAAILGLPFVIKSLLTTEQQASRVIEPAPLSSAYPFGGHP